MGDKDDYLTSYRVFFENFAATVNPEDQLPVNIAGYTITEAELPGEVIYWTTQYLTEKQCPPSLMTPLRRIILEEVRTAAKNHPNDFGFRHDESAFVALQLMQAVMARVNAVCLRYLDNSQLDSLPPPALLERDLRTVASATKNLRRVMEDRHVVIGNLEALFGIEATEPTSFYAVYDGHAGSAAATYCAAHLHQYLVESPYFQMDLRRAMQEAFLRTDEEFVRKSNQKRACGGSTAVAVVVRGQTLLAAWAGDSLALLTKRMRLMQLVHPHKPNRQDERERIESSGGTIMYYGTWRVNGQLAVSRAIGDAKYKPYVTAKPEIALVELDGDEDFVVVACDGLWDFVSEDKVALSIYAQLVADPDDLKAVTKRLIAQAKQEGSPDNITVIVVFLKDPRDIVAFINHPPMDLGLDNALSNAPPFATEAEGRKLDAVAMAIDDCGDVEADADNGVSDSDSEDFGPETAVDVDDVDDADGDQHEPAPPTPPAHAVEAGHVDGVLVDNVAESGEESEDEWNYYKGEGEPERDEQNPSEEADEPPRSDTPCQDNSAWESSSVDMNSSPLNPDAPVFVPGGVAGSDVLLAESPRKPLPMDDIELPDVAQFQTEAVIRPAELLNLDNSDHLNGHHNMSIDATTEQMNGNGKCNMDSLGFGFNVNEESDKMKDTSLIKEFERIQKDTTDYCDIQVQVFQAHTETNPFDERDDELFERLKNKERDPMSMSFYQEKDDDTCERFTKIEGHIDLNAVQPLPDSDDEDIQQNGAYDITIQNEKENVPPEQSCLFEQVDVQEPNNDILKFDDRTENVVNNGSNVDNFEDYNINNTNNMQSYSNVEFECNNISQDILQTDTPESHKLLFEQIPEIPDGKSSELGFTNDDLQDCSESDKDIRVVTPDDEISQDIESKSDESPIADTQTDFIEADIKDDSEREKDIQLESDSQADDSTNELILENITDPDQPELIEDPVLQSAITDQTQAILHEIPNELKNIRDSHEIAQTLNHFVQDTKENIVLDEIIESKSNLIEAVDLTKTPSIEFEAELGPSEEENIISKSPLPSESPALSPIPGESPLPVVREIPSSPMLEIKSPIPNNELLEDLVATSPLPTQSPLPSDSTFEQTSPVPQDDGTLSPLPAEVPLPRESPLPSESPLPREIQCLEEDLPCESTTSVDADLVPKSPLPVESPEPNSLASTTGLLVEASSCAASPLITKDSVLPQSPIPGIISVQDETSTEEQKGESPLPIDNDTLEITEDLAPSTQTLEINEEILHVESPPPGDLLQPSKSPLPTEQLITKSPLPIEELSSLQTSSLQSEIVIDEMLLPVEEDHLSKSPLSQELVSEQKLPLCEELSQPTEPFVVNETQLLSETQVDAQPASPVKTEESFETSHHLESTPELISQNTTELLMEKEVPSDSPVPSISPIPVESTETVTSLIDNFQQLDIEDKVTELICESRLTPQETVQEHLESSSVTQPETILVETSSGPTPDLVPDERIDFPQTRNELITDIDIGIPESRAQEICVPVTSEIQQDDVVEPSAGTPPLTPAVEPVQVAPTTLDIPLLSETPMAGDTETLAAVSATAGVAAVAAAAATVAAKSKTPATKKSPTTPTTKTLKPAPKSTAATPRTPASAVKKTATASPAAKTLSATKLSVTKTPLSAKTTPTLKAAPKTSMSPSKPATPISKAAAKPTLAAVKEAPAVAKTAPAAGARPATRAPAKPTNAKPIPSAPKTGTTAAKPLAPRSTARPAATRLSNTSTAAPPATKPKEAKPKTSAPKPLANGDVKPATKSAPKPAVTARPAAKPAPKPAPRTATAALPGNAVPAKPTAPRAAARVPLDKQSKDLANKRITAKSAPPRTAPAKVPIGAKSTSAKTGPKKVELPKKEVQENGLSNGAAPVKLPPSPPPADNALLPDVIA